MNNLKDKLLNEYEELNIKIIKLSEFITTAGFMELDSEPRHLLQLQIEAMRQYLSIIDIRLELLE